MTLNKKNLIRVLAVSTFLLGGAQLARADLVQADGHDDGLSAAQMNTVKIGIQEAIEKALKEHAGQIVEAKLEMENERLVYSIEYFGAGEEEVELLVDAITGQVSNGEDAEDVEDGKDD